MESSNQASISVKAIARTIFSTLPAYYDSVVMLMTFYRDRAWKFSLLRYIDTPKRAKIADVGSGTALLEGYLTDQEFICGIDISLDMLYFAKEKRFSSLELVLGDAEKLPLRNNAFDTVFSCYVVKYCNTFTFVNEVYRILKRGGKLGLYDFSKPSGVYAPLHALYAYGTLKLLGYLMLAIKKEIAYTFLKLPNLIINSVWEEKIEEALERTGFQNISSTLKLGARLCWAKKS
ncbi:MAG: class I SAM-dependent methyltransferase [Conexivisphaerales archaeon]